MNIKKLFLDIILSIFLIATIFTSYFFGSFYLLISSLTFLVFGGIFEEIIMNRFYSKSTKKISKKDNKIKKIKNGFLWVHSITKFIKTYGLTIYDFKKTGYTPFITSYLFIGIYILIVTTIYSTLKYYAIAIYLIPIITNIYDFLKNRYYIFK